jgi:hypothetical protein
MNNDNIEDIQTFYTMQCSIEDKMIEKTLANHTINMLHIDEFIKVSGFELLTANKKVEIPPILNKMLLMIF